MGGPAGTAREAPAPLRKHLEHQLRSDLASLREELIAGLAAATAASGDDPELSSVAVQADLAKQVTAEPAELSALPSTRGRNVGWDVRLRNLDQPSGLREAPEGASPRGSTASLQGVGLTRLIVGTRPTVPSWKRIARDWRCG